MSPTLTPTSMIELFLTLSEPGAAVMQSGQWNYLRRGLQRNVDKVRQYYQTFPSTLPSNHFLVRLLQTFPVPASLPLDRFQDRAETAGMRHATVLGMTSSISTGHLFRGTFYGGSTPEYLLAVNDYFDAERVDRDWRNVVAVRPLMHAKSDLALLLPNGQPSSSERGLSVILVNIPMLAVQYRAFLRSEAGKVDPDTTARFIAAYVLPNMLASHLELCLFNRLDQIEEAPSDVRQRLTRQHPFALPHYEYYVDNVLEEVLEYVSKGTLEFRAILRTLPSVQQDSLYQSLQMPDVFPTRQVDWLLQASRLKVMDFLFRVTGDYVRPRNQIHINQLMRSYRRNDVWRVMQDQLPVDALGEVMRYTERIREGAEQDFI